MSASNGVIFVPAMSPDPRLRVFRRTLDLPGEFSGMEVDSYVVVTEHFVVVLDTMLCPEDMADVMSYLRDDLPGRQLLVVNSHADWDHCWGNNYFIGEHVAPIIAQDYCRERMESDEAAVGLRDYQQRFAVFRNVKLISPTITFSDTFTISDGDLTIELFPAPGHHPDHIAAWIPQLRLLLAFDAVEKPIPVVEGAASVPSMFTTLERLLALQPQVALCSHGNVTDPRLISDTLAYFRNIEWRGRAFLQSRAEHPITSEELEHASTVLRYPFAEVIAGNTGTIDTAFYSWAHEENCRAMLQWLTDNANTNRQVH